MDDNRPSKRKKIAGGIRFKEPSSKAAVDENWRSDQKGNDGRYRDQVEKGRERDRERFRDRERAQDEATRKSNKPAVVESHAKEVIPQAKVQEALDGEEDEHIRAKFGDIKTSTKSKGSASVEDKFGPAAFKANTTKEKLPPPNVEETQNPKPKKEKKTKIAPTDEPMIIVNVNDRLGTRAAIPCLASDPIRLFKAQVAARIGREPHEIMLKRQGERPFKDALTLEDYGVSNGVQLDLEVDTGD